MPPDPQVLTDPDACPICGAVPVAYSQADDVVRQCANGDTWHYDPGTGAKTVDTTAVAALTISAISPNTGPAAGGTAVTITGTGFVEPLYADIGGVALDLVIVNSTTVTCVTPPHAAGAVDVLVSHYGDYAFEQHLTAAYTFA